MNRFLHRDWRVQYEKKPRSSQQIKRDLRIVFDWLEVFKLTLGMLAAETALIVWLVKMLVKHQ